VRESSTLRNASLRVGLRGSEIVAPKHAAIHWLDCGFGGANADCLIRSRSISLEPPCHDGIEAGKSGRWNPAAPPTLS